MYFLSIPVMFLLWHSSYLLAKKYNKQGDQWSEPKLPLWLIIYFFFSFCYITATPAVVIYAILDEFKTDETISFTISIIISSVVLVAYIKNLPTTKANS